MKRGFTLLELVIVIIIIGILATFGFSQYIRFTERARVGEAKALLGDIRTAEEAYYTENSAYANVTSQDDFNNTLKLLNIPYGSSGTCGNTGYYFAYQVTGAGAATYTATATRCTGGGKNPNSTAATANAYTLTVDQTGTYTGTATWQK